MKIFISQSKARSHAVAQALRKWIPMVIQVIEGVWVSSEDISKGSTWDEEVAETLEGTDFGIVCITPENRTEPWLLYEAGALSKHRKTAAVWTFLFDIQPTDVQAPLAKFQHTKATEKEDVFKMMQSINAALQKREEKPLAPEVLRSAFDNLWPALERDLQAIPPPQLPIPKPPKDSEKINEILETVRELSRRMPPEKKDDMSVVKKFLQMSPYIDNELRQTHARKILMSTLSTKYRLRFRKLELEKKNDLSAQGVWNNIMEYCMKGDFEIAEIILDEWWRERSRESDQTAELPDE